MDISFLKIMSESYVYDSDDNKLDSNVLFELIFSDLQYLKENNYEVYNYLHGLSKSKQQDILYRYFENEEIIEESLIVAIIGSMIPVFILFFGQEKAAIFYNKLKDFFFNIRKTMVDFIENKDEFRRIKVINSIIDSDFDSCRQKCEIVDNSKDDDLKYALIKKYKPEQNWIEKSFGTRITPDTAIKAQCALSCYIGYVTSVFAELLYSYDQCLSKTGERLDFNKGIDLFTSFPAGESCKYLREKIIDLHKDFEDILKVFYKETPRLEQDIINQLDQKIKSAKQGFHTKTNIMLPSIDFKSKSVNI